MYRYQVYTISPGKASSMVLFRSHKGSGSTDSKYYHFGYDLVLLRSNFPLTTFKCSFLVRVDVRVNFKHESREFIHWVEPVFEHSPLVGLRSYFLKTIEQLAHPKLFNAEPKNTGHRSRLGIQSDQLWIYRF